MLRKWDENVKQINCLSYKDVENKSFACDQLDESADFVCKQYLLLL